MNDDNPHDATGPRSGKRTAGMVLTLLGSTIVFGFGWVHSIVMVAGILIAAAGLWLAINY